MRSSRIWRGALAAVAAGLLVALATVLADAVWYSLHLVDTSLAVVTLRRNSTPGARCSGSVVSLAGKKMILTADHCRYEANFVHVPETNGLQSLAGEHFIPIPGRGAAMITVAGVLDLPGPVPIPSSAAPLPENSQVANPLYMGRLRIVGDCKPTQGDGCVHPGTWNPGEAGATICAQALPPRHCFDEGESGSLVVGDGFLGEVPVRTGTEIGIVALSGDTVLPSGQTLSQFVKRCVVSNPPADCTAQRITVAAFNRVTMHLWATFVGFSRSVIRAF